MKTITTKMEMSTKVGSCNGCTRHITEDDIIPHQVCVLHLNSANIRLCKHCVQKLMVDFTKYSINM